MKESFASVLGKLNFTLCVNTKLHYGISHNFISATPILHNFSFVPVCALVCNNTKKTVSLLAGCLFSVRGRTWRPASVKKTRSAVPAANDNILEPQILGLLQQHN